MVNEIFQGRYKILRVLGEGGMGKVYLAENINLKTLWAIKEISKKKNTSFDLLAEPNMLKNLNHPALPRIFDIFENEDFLYIIEDYVEGVSLDKALKTVEKYPEHTVIDWAKQICDVLIYLHNLKPNPIIYRDMKPSNLIVNSEGKVKLIDFGIAREYKAQAAEDTTVIGTRGYAAPEQYGTKQTDARTDIYSLGVTLYHLITGKSPNDPPYELVPVRQLDKKLSAGIEHIIKKCTQLNPDKRYQSAEKLLFDLENIHKYNKEAKRKRLLLELRIVFYAFLLTGAVLISYFGYQQMGIEKEDKYTQLLQTAETFFVNGEYGDSIQLFEESTQIFPERLNGYLGIAKNYLKEMEYEKCIDYIENTVGRSLPEIIGDPEANYILGNAWYELKDYARSVHYYSRAVHFSENIEAYWRDLGVSQARSGNLADAENTMLQMEEKGMSEAATQYLHGEILYKQSGYSEALTKFYSVLDLETDQQLLRRTYTVIGEIIRDHGLSLEGSYKKGIEVLLTSEGKLKEKNNIIIMELLAELYYLQAESEPEDTAKNKAYESSAQYFQKLIDVGYRRPYIYRNIAIIQQNLEQYGMAEKTLMEMEKQYPENYEVYVQYAFLYADIESKKENQSRSYEKVVENYEKAVKYAPEKDASVELLPLKNLIEDLREKNWIE